MKKFFYIIILVAIAAITYFNWCKIFNFLQIEWKEILTTIIGGSIGGLITYSYVIHIENKREARMAKMEHDKDEKEKKEKCTKSLLSTQMAISIQMDASKGIEEIANNILNFNLCGETLENLLKTTSIVSQRANILFNLIKSNNCQIENLLPLTNYLLIHSESNNAIDLPYEIFELSTISLNKKNIVPEIAYYFQRLVSCNRKYVRVISLIKRNNGIRDLIINQPIQQGEAGMQTRITDEELYKYLMVVAGMFTLAFDLKEMIIKYLEIADDVFSKTAEYIKLLDISEPIQPARDENGKVIFDKV